ncbi:MAG: DUF1636 domain-containing protein [Myxococcota bacterium]
MNGPAQPYRRCVLHVCTSCRAPGSPREPFESRPGYQLYRELRSSIGESALADYVEVRSAECLSLCPRPCGIALSSAGAWSYLFGDQSLPSAREVEACVELYARTTDGFMPRDQRPKSLRASVLGRVPPLPGGR